MKKVLQIDARWNKASKAERAAMLIGGGADSWDHMKILINRCWNNLPVRVKDFLKAAR